MNFLQAIGLTYLITVNIVGGAVAFSDKQKARKAQWRVPEKNFLLFALCGGGLGVLASFMMFHHKTRHGKLLAGVIALTVLFYGVLIAALFLLS
jgi:uncharacterized membrane protein YsdA (DUF1294 family)